MLQNGRLNLDVTWHRRTYVRTYLYTRRAAYPTTATAGAVRAAVASNNSRVKYATTVIVPGSGSVDLAADTAPPLLLSSPPFLSTLNRVVHAFFYRDRSWRAQRNAVKKRFGETVPSFPTNEFEEANSIRVPAWVGVDFSVRDVGIGRRRERRSRAGWVGNETTALLAGRWKI